MFGKHHTEVLVVGAGPVGMMTALTLTQEGIKVVLIDEERSSGARSYALALHPASMKLLDQLGLATQALEDGYRIDKIGLYDGVDRRAELDLSVLPVQFPYLTVLGQDRLEKLLAHRLHELGVEILWSHRLSRLEPNHSGMSAVIDKLEQNSMGYGVATYEYEVEKTRRLDADWVVGADGHDSTVRRRLDIEFEQIAPPSTFAVFELQNKREAVDEMRVVLTGTDISALWPLTDARCRWSFQVNEPPPRGDSRYKQRLAVQIGSQAYQHHTEEELDAFLAQRAPWFTKDIEEICWSIGVRFERKLVRELGRDHAWLVGDSAHITGPVGMQSMNLGLLEAHDLASRLAHVMRKGASPELMADYGRKRMAEWRQLFGLEQKWTATGRTDPWIMQHSARLLECLPASGQELVGLAKQIGLELPLV